MTSHKMFKMRKENNSLTKRLISMDKKALEWEVAHKELVEVFECAKSAHQKTEAELTQLKLGFVE